MGVTGHRADVDLLPEALAARVTVSDACWLWTGARRRSGQARVRWAGHTQDAHTVVWQLLLGPMPTAAELVNRCGSSRCVNPRHHSVQPALGRLAPQRPSTTPTVEQQLALFDSLERNRP